MPVSQYPKVSLVSDSFVAEAEFSRGITADMPRSSVPEGALVDAKDFMVDKVGVLYKRGGWTYQGGVFGNVNGVQFVIAPEFPTGPKVVALGGDGNVYDITDPTNIGSAILSAGIQFQPQFFGTVDNPHLFVDRVIVPFSNGTRTPGKITAPGGVVTVGTWGGTPPPGMYATVHLGRVVLARSAANPNRIWFSPPYTVAVSDAEHAWDAAKYHMDTNHMITGIVPCQGVLLVFSDGHTERVVGDIIPGAAGENMSLQPVGEVGCVDARTICAWRGNVVFAGSGGIWVTNGVGFDSLVEKDDGSGIASYWRNLFDSTLAGVPGGAIFAAGIYARDYYFISCTYAGTVSDTLICYLPRKAWTRVSNTGVRSFAPNVVGFNELYGGTSEGMPGNRVIRLATFFKPNPAWKADANGVPVLPSMQTRMIGEGIGVKAYGHGHITYDLRDAATDNPRLRLESSVGIEAGSGWSLLPEGATMDETAQVTRKRFMVNRDGQTMNLSIDQLGPSAETEIYAIEQEVRPYNAPADGT